MTKFVDEEIRDGKLSSKITTFSNFVMGGDISNIYELF